MKAAFIERHGGPEVLQYGDLLDPVAGPGEVVIDTVAAQGDTQVIRNAEAELRL